MRSWPLLLSLPLGSACGAAIGLSHAKWCGLCRVRATAASPDKPVAWLLEGDFVQYTYDDQASPLSMTELGALARDIVCAIKSSQPNALVALDHSAWLADAVTNQFWAAMPTTSLDFMWTTGVGNNAGFFAAGSKAVAVLH